MGRARNTAAVAPPRDVVADIEAEVHHIEKLNVANLRSLWRTTFKEEPSKTLTPSLLMWILCWDVQERAFGGHDRAALQLLGAYAQGKPARTDPLLRLKPGTELVREYQGKRHVVTIGAHGFAWEGKTYPSLTAIACQITGFRWNGPRFFGLRATAEERVSDQGEAAGRSARPEEDRMKSPPAPKIVRCAIYTRKSTEHNLDLEFNSLDAQREACEAYIKSQAHEGWRLKPDRYDDGGLSGASLERPALQALLKVVEAGQIDVVVVYKVDRLTRSLTDFAKLVELFDRYKVSFVSITQAFNTTTSMGRLTLNVLLSFAQFEREVIGERVRDKIAASKRKGIWVGGPVPLGYASVNKKIVVVPDEAKTVREIFRRYLDLGSIRLLAADLDAHGIRTKQRQLANGDIVGGGKFGVGALAHFLGNRFYIGKIAYRGEIHIGEHEPIVDQVLFDAVQAKLAANNVERRFKIKARLPVLAGRIFDDRGNSMIPSHTNKNGVRYRYYVSSAVQQKNDKKLGYIQRVSAPEIETVVLETLRDRCRDVANMEDDEDIWKTLERVEVLSKELNVHARDANDHVTVQWQQQPHVAVKGVLGSPDTTPVRSEKHDVLLTVIAKARTWVEELKKGRTMAEIAKREGRVERYIRLLLPLAFVSPAGVRAVVAGTHITLAVTELAIGLRCLWQDQHKL